MRKVLTAVLPAVFLACLLAASSQAFGPAPDVTDPVLTLTAPSPQNASKPLEATVDCDEFCTMVVSGKLKVEPKRKGRTVKARLKQQIFEADGGDPVSVSLETRDERSENAIERAIRDGGKGVFTIKGRAEDRSDNTTFERVKGKLE